MEHNPPQKIKNLTIRKLRLCHDVIVTLTMTQHAQHFSVVGYLVNHSSAQLIIIYLLLTEQSPDSNLIR